MRLWRKLAVAIPFFSAGGLSVILYAELSLRQWQSALFDVPPIAVMFGYGWWKFSTMLEDAER